MSYWNTRGLRGSAFEEVLNITNEKYRKDGLALIQKVPTPITPIKMDKEKSTEKIDAAVATVMALDHAIRNQGGEGSVYDGRGILVF